MDPIARLISHFTKFPGVGNKSARRMVFYLLKQDAAQLRELGAGIASLKDDLHTCSECGNISDGDPCPICRDALRDRRTLCVVENIDDLVSFEQARSSSRRWSFFAVPVFSSMDRKIKTVLIYHWYIPMVY